MAAKLTKYNWNEGLTKLIRTNSINSVTWTTIWISKNGDLIANTVFAGDKGGGGWSIGQIRVGTWLRLSDGLGGIFGFGLKQKTTNSVNDYQNFLLELP